MLTVNWKRKMENQEWKSEKRIGLLEPLADFRKLEEDMVNWLAGPLPQQECYCQMCERENTYIATFCCRSHLYTKFLNIYKEGDGQSCISCLLQVLQSFCCLSWLFISCRMELNPAIPHPEKGCILSPTALEQATHILDILPCSKPFGRNARLDEKWQPHVHNITVRQIYKYNCTG